jgi:mono/diheme cytochrome c family protein
MMIPRIRFDSIPRIRAAVFALPLASLLQASLVMIVLPNSPLRAADTIDFARDVRPLLSDHCYACHGPDANTRQAELRLDQHSPDLAERHILVAGDLDGSEAWQRIQSSDPEKRMPPPEFNKDLTDAQKDVLRRWIEQGATMRRHWSFETPKRAAEPAVRNSDWPAHALDRFVLARLEQEGLRPSPPADARTLVRRLYLDLTGLPPTPQQSAALELSSHPHAYERLVDELLDSPHFGERMAVAWLDQSRYADTNGYSIDGGRQMTLYRDWVIQAYNRNLPFNQFVVDQLAGDLLPEATNDQLVASGFNRNHMITHEGGTIPEENLVNYVADRVRTTGEVFLGMTLGCAQCHDHKYDPITQRDYYQMFAYFNGLQDRGLDGDGGVNSVPSQRLHSTFAADASQIDDLRAELATLQSRLTQPLESQPAWEEAAREELARRGRDLQVLPVQVLKVTSPNRGGEYDVKEDGTVNALGGSDRSLCISAALAGITTPITGLRILFTPHESLPKAGIGRGDASSLEGSFVLTSFTASATGVPSDQIDLYRMVPIREATASASHPDFPPADTLDERDHNGWSPHPHNQTPQHITWQFASPVDPATTPFVTVMLVWGGGPFGNGSLQAGQYRVVAITGHDDGTNIPEEVQRILEVAEGERSAEQRERIRAYHASVATELANTRFQIKNLEERIAYLTQPQEVMVMDSANPPRATHILNRGQYDQPLEKVEPTTITSLLPAAPDQPANRLGLAQWLTRPEHPLTARVAVNRVWQLFFGTGLVSTSADFGAQGEPPSHPELLDWLAVDFVENDWNVKRLVKQIVMSSTYRQSSDSSPEQLTADPTNRLLGRGPRFRLQAEFVRDQALAVSGLLVDRLGGPSVLPYQPGVLWREISHFGSSPATSQVFVQDHGEKLYRRSLYTYWKRTSPPPSMITFDAPTREVCTVQRSSTNTPLQSLVLLNDPQFVEASRALAQRILREAPADTDARLQFAFEVVLGRPASDRELAIVRRAYERERARYAADPNAAREYLSIGESYRDGQLPPEEHAAWASVGSLLLNLSETVTRS